MLLGNPPPVAVEKPRGRWYFNSYQWVVEAAKGDLLRRDRSTTVDLSKNEQRVIEVIRAVFANKRQTPPALNQETVLDLSLGLESIDFAELVVRLEGEFGEDPFANGMIPSIRTIGDLAKLYPA